MGEGITDVVCMAGVGVCACLPGNVCMTAVERFQGKGLLTVEGMVCVK